MPAYRYPPTGPPMWILPVDNRVGCGQRKGPARWHVRGPRAGWLLGADLDLHGRAAGRHDADGRAGRGQLHAGVRLLGVPVLLGVVEQRVRRLAADVARLAVHVERERVGLLQRERRVVTGDPLTPRHTKKYWYAEQPNAGVK